MGEYADMSVDAAMLNDEDCAHSDEELEREIVWLRQFQLEGEVGRFYTTKRGLYGLTPDDAWIHTGNRILRNIIAFWLKLRGFKRVGKGQARSCDTV